MKRFQITSDAELGELSAFFAGQGSAKAGPKLEDKIETTRWIVDAVQDKGDAALADFTQRFDGVALTPEQFELSPQEIEQAVRTVPRDFIAILERAHENIRRFHAKNLRESWEETSEDGTLLGQRITPIESAGVYVPGGKAYYPSSVLMNIVPARVAGVREIVMVSPPSYEGSIHPGVLAAAKVAGATRIFRIGGAQAIAALAYGTRTIPAVSKITGPGNAYVAAAKGLVRGVVEIDSEAGPSEVAVIADKDARPAFVAAELLAQAEHDEDAMCVLLTDSEELAEAALTAALEEAARMERRDIIRASLDANGVIAVLRDLNEAVLLTDIIAPEHLSIQTVFPRKIADQVRNAGAMMLGPMTPVAAGDYYAGPNHILPTGRRARFASPLTAEDFRKVTSVIHYSGERLARDAEDIIEFAQLEGLRAHARSVEVRVETENARR